MKILGNLVLGTHQDPDFYHSMRHRAAPALGESAEALRWRIFVNLERDGVVRAVAKNIVVWSVLFSFALAVTGDLTPNNERAKLQKEVDAKSAFTAELARKLDREAGLIK